MKNIRSRSRTRRAAEVIELALVLPIMVLITIGTLELCEGILLRKKLTIAAHEGARVAALKEATAADVYAEVTDYLDARGIQYGDIATAVTFEPAAPENVPKLTPITVSVSVAANPNLRMSVFYRFLGGTTSTGEVTFYKEGTHSGFGG